jgi:SAM-dependent methyltransferase
MPSKDYEKYTDEWRKDMGDWYFSLPPNWQLRAYMWGGIVPIIKKETDELSVLEVGGGCGYNLNAIGLYYLPKKITRCVNLEPSPTQREFCQKTYNDMEVVDGMVDKMPFKDGEFDLVVSAGLLLHIPREDLDQSLREIFRVAKRYVVIIEYWSEEEMPGFMGDGFEKYTVPHWSRDYSKPIVNLGVPFKLRLTTPMVVRILYNTGGGRDNVYRGYFYERES